ncbi:MAG: type I 3-dehydroquinate dehydratase, partial [Silvanigrellaceae bacterium]|nr:type I 3-dehydroquinate dehydratase [Silvanigrellaceae bacterium]
MPSNFKTSAQMLVGVVCPSSFAELQSQLAELEYLVCSAQQPDILEIRLDFIQDIHINLDNIKQNLIPQKIIFPIILTLRSSQEGGFYSGGEEQRRAIIWELAETLQPAFIDLEASIDAHWLSSFQAHYPKIKIILSYHNFKGTDKNISEILSMMQQKANASFYKIALYTHSTLEALELLCFLNDVNDNKKIILIPMGEKGKSCRILTPIFGSALFYCALFENKFTAPGQLTITEAQSIYHIAKLNEDTKIYGLLGDPVEQSIGHLFHNEYFNKLNLNAIYVKWQIPISDLKKSILLLKKLNINGLSITMPLKEKILPFLDELNIDAKNIGAVNTVVTHNGKWVGYNTDGKGALETIKLNVQGKTIALLGAGGAAKAIIYEALKLNAKVIVFNRTLKKLKQISTQFKNKQLDYSSLENFNALNNILHYDILINTLPFNISLPKFLLQKNAI